MTKHDIGNGNNFPFKLRRTLCWYSKLVSWFDNLTFVRKEMLWFLTRFSEDRQYQISSEAISYAIPELWKTCSSADMNSVQGETGQKDADNAKRERRRWHPTLLFTHPAAEVYRVAMTICCWDSMVVHEHFQRRFLSFLPPLICFSFYFPFPFLLSIFSPSRFPFSSVCKDKLKIWAS
jgi:hypothetical protein